MLTINLSGNSRLGGLAMAAVMLLAFAASAATAPSTNTEQPPAATNWTSADEERFLLTAKVVKSEPISGVEGAERVTLSNGSETHDALVRTVEAYTYLWAAIRDSYRYNLAAYRLDKMLGLGVVPVTVERKIGGQMASLTWWPEGGTPGADGKLAAFRELVNAPVDATPNLPDAVSNSDYSQAFSSGGDLPDPEQPEAINREFYESLRALDRHQLARAMHSLLSKSEIESLWRRRHEILENYHPRFAGAGTSLGGARPGR